MNTKEEEEWIGIIKIVIQDHNHKGNRTFFQNSKNNIEIYLKALMIKTT